MLETIGVCGLTVLGEGHAIVASRFASAGRPSARHLLESVPWTRTAGGGAIVLTGAPAALECRLDRMALIMGYTARPARIDWVCSTCGTAVGSVTDPATMERFRYDEPRRGNL